MTRKSEIDIRNVFKKIPKTIENNTKPFRYSFLSGLKKVLNRSGIDKRDTTYLLSETKKVIKFRVTSIYQKESKYSG